MGKVYYQQGDSRQTVREIAKLGISDGSILINRGMDADSFKKEVKYLLGKGQEVLYDPMAYMLSFERANLDKFNPDMLGPSPEKLLESKRRSARHEVIRDWVNLQLDAGLTTITLPYRVCSSYADLQLQLNYIEDAYDIYEGENIDLLPVLCIRSGLLEAVENSLEFADYVVSNIMFNRIAVLVIHSRIQAGNQVSSSLVTGMSVLQLAGKSHGKSILYLYGGLNAVLLAALTGEPQTVTLGKKYTNIHENRWQKIKRKPVTGPIKRKSWSSIYVPCLMGNVAPNDFVRMSQLKMFSKVFGEAIVERDKKGNLVPYNECIGRINHIKQIGGVGLNSVKQLIAEGIGVSQEVLKRELISEPRSIPRHLDAWVDALPNIEKVIKQL